MQFHHQSVIGRNHWSYDLKLTLTAAVVGSIQSVSVLLFSFYEDIDFDDNATGF